MGWYGPQGDCGCCEDTPPGGCTILEDNFDRDNSSDLGDDWEEISGSWSISSNQLSGSGLVLTVPERADTTVNYTVEAFLGIGGRIVFDADEFGNYHYLHNDTFNIRFGNQSGLIASYGYGSGFLSRIVKVCVVGSRMTINWGESGTAIGAQTRTFTPYGGLRAGVAAASSVTVNNFAFQIHDSTQDGCDNCQGGCSSGCCSNGVLAEYVVDLGEPGLTNVECDECASIGGEYTLSFVTNCQWNYNSPFECSGGCLDPCNPDARFSISASLFNCTWTVTIRVGDPGQEDPDCSDAGCATDIASYSYTMTNPTECNELDITLTHDGGAPSKACSGTWPATITLRAAA